jgi:hypothetical protein
MTATHDRSLTVDRSQEYRQDIPPALDVGGVPRGILERVSLPRASLARMLRHLHAAADGVTDAREARWLRDDLLCACTEDAPGPIGQMVGGGR